MSRKPPSQSDPVSALQRGFDVLDCFAEAKTPLGTSLVAEMTGIPKPTVSRLIATLVGLGHLRVARDGEKYELGAGVVRLAQAFLGGIDIRDYARPFLRHLASATGATSYLGVRDGDEMLLVECGRSRTVVAVVGVDIGARMSMHSSALGRAWLAAADGATRDTLLAQFRAADPDWELGRGRALDHALAQTWRSGFAMSMGEWHPSTNAIAVPVRTASGELFSINCGAPTFVLSAEVLCRDVAPVLMDAADGLAAEIGGSAGLAAMDATRTSGVARTSPQLASELTAGGELRLDRPQ